MLGFGLIAAFVTVVFTASSVHKRAERTADHREQRRG
jgi:hypothetical protein